MTKLNGQPQIKRDYNRNESARQYYCQGLCDDLEDNPAGATKKYSIHVYCSRCGKWMLQASMIANEKCPCCHFRPRWKGRNNKTRNNATPNTFEGC